MFIRYNSGVNKFFKIAAVVLIGILVLPIIWKVGGLMEHVALNVYIGMISSEYNIANYSRDIEEDEDDGTDIMDNVVVSMVNGQSSLYGYIHQNKELQYVYEDPAYNALILMVEDNRERDDKVLDNEEGSDKADMDKQNEEEADQKDDGQQADSGYVVPAVSEAGVTYSMEELSNFDFLMSKLYIVPDRALVYESDLVAKDMVEKDMTMKGDSSKPQILIYHTHSQEGFVDSVAGDDATSIVAVGSYLAKILSEEYGYNVIHCTEHFDIAGGTLDRSTAYTYAQGTIEQILEDNPSIEVILDIHRDGLPEGADKLVTNINGKDTAKIMFFNGVSRSSAAGEIDYLYNRYRADNLAFSFQLKLAAMKFYPEFTRRNYIDAYQYNLHHRQKSVLVEVGAQNNTLQEALNSMEVLSEVLHRVLEPQDT